MTHYKYVFLIIDSDNDSCYPSNREIIRKYMKLYNTDVLYYFIRFSEESIFDNGCDYVLRDDILYFQGSESFIPGILDKTINAMKYCIEHISFDFIIRTNLSSFWNIIELLNIYSTLNHDQCVYAVRGYGGNTIFPSGAGYICPREVIRFIVGNDIHIQRNVNDDVAIGKLLANNNIHVIDSNRYNFISNTINGKVTDNDIQNILKLRNYHYRVKGEIRDNDNRVFQMLYNNIYGHMTNSSCV